MDKKINGWHSDWQKGQDYPAWGDTEVYKKTITGGYLLQGETPKDAYWRVANAVAKRLYKPELAEKFFDYIWKVIIICIRIIYETTMLYQKVSCKCRFT